MKIKEVMLQTNIPEKTIRYYESRGLISTETARRNGRTYHEFSQESIQDLKRIITLRRARFSLEEIEIMQKDPEQLQKIVSGYLARIQQEQKELQELGSLIDLDKASDWRDLSCRIEQSAITIPGYEPNLNFRQFDEETEEERERAITAYRRKEKTKAQWYIWVIAALSVICMFLVITDVMLMQQSSRSIPAPTTTTEGWVYYEYDCNLMRSLPDGTQAELVYERKSYAKQPQYIVTEMKIYVLDDSLYSINADGSGEYEYKPKIGASYTNDGGEDFFTLYGDDIYVLQNRKGALTEKQNKLTKVPVDGSAQQELTVDISDWSYVFGSIWGDKIYLFGAVSDYDENENWISIPEAKVYDLSLQKVTETVRDDSTTLGNRTYTGAYMGTDFGYIFDTNAVAADSGILIKLTPQDLQGQIIKEYPAQLAAANATHVIYTVADSQKAYLENIETGVSVELPAQETLDHGNGAYEAIGDPVYYQFTEEGLRVVYAADQWELIMYP